MTGDEISKTWNESDAAIEKVVRKKRAIKQPAIITEIPNQDKITMIRVFMFVGISFCLLMFHLWDSSRISIKSYTTGYQAGIDYQKGLN